ncbi:hypothetical protein ACHAWF_002857, partial [Thalassiosira exigua]
STRSRRPKLAVPFPSAQRKNRRICCADPRTDSTGHTASDPTINEMPREKLSEEEKRRRKRDRNRKRYAEKKDEIKAKRERRLLDMPDDEYEEFRQRQASKTRNRRLQQTREERKEENRKRRELYKLEKKKKALHIQTSPEVIPTPYNFFLYNQKHLFDCAEKEELLNLAYDVRRLQGQKNMICLGNFRCRRVDGDPDRKERSLARSLARRQKRKDI